MAKIKVNVTLDEELINRIDCYADDNYMSRSTLISFACTQFLTSAEVTKAITNMAFAMRKIADSNQIDDETRRQLEDFERVANMFMAK